MRAVKRIFEKPELTMTRLDALFHLFENTDVEAKAVCARADTHPSTLHRAKRTGRLKDSTLDKLCNAAILEIKEKQVRLSEAISTLLKKDTKKNG